MRSVNFLTVSLFVTIFTASYAMAGGAPSSGSEEMIYRIFHLASNKKSDALEGMRSVVVASNDRVVARAYPVALFMSDPRKYEGEFVDAFPVDHEGLMQDLYGIELKMLTPNFLFSVDAIGQIAKSGNQKAIRKVLVARANSDGVVGERLCEIFTDLAKDQPGKILAALSGLDRNEREASYQCLEMMASDEISALKKAFIRFESKASDREKEVIEEVKSRAAS